MSNTAKAFAPANISCLFKIFDHKDPRWRGSYGCGFTVNEGVVVEVDTARKNEIQCNGEIIIFPAVEKVVEALTTETISVSILSKLPLGHGFGISGASALATAYALNKLLNLRKTEKELAIIAHIAEVESGTGLGDVINQLYGGFVIKFQPSSEFVVQKLSFENTSVYVHSFDQLSTKNIISNPKIRAQINEAATEILDFLQSQIDTKKEFTFQEVVKLAKQFAETSGLLTHQKVKDTIDQIEKNGGTASMIMLGNGVFSTIPFENCIELRISNLPAHLIES